MRPASEFETKINPIRNNFWSGRYSNPISGAGEYFFSALMQKGFRGEI